MIGAGTCALALSAGSTYALVRMTQGTQGTQGTPSLAEGLPDLLQPSGDGARLFNAVGCAKCHVLARRFLYDGRATTLRHAALELDAGEQKAVYLFISSL